MTTTWTPPAASRGTVVVLPGRGEHPGVYERLGQRLAADGYTVVAARRGADGAGVAALFGAHPEGTRILLGSDDGAVRAWSVAAQTTPAPDALVLAGLPLEHGAVTVPGGPEAELALRTACPVHRARLGADPQFSWGQLGADVDDPPSQLPDLPILLLHGDADQVAPIGPVRLLAGQSPQATLGVVAGGLHDVLNDQFHRSVAARLVLFVEEIGKGAVLRDDAPRPAPRSTRSRRSGPLHVSARLDYALRAIAELPSADHEPMRCETIARSRGIPLNSLVNLMVELRKAGLVHSRRGCEGGYWLTRPAGETTVADVVRAVEGEITSLHSADADSWLWQRLGDTVDEFLRHHSVADLHSGLRSELPAVTS
ncbi:Rrf2 family transcriptional regulator [Pseudonocardia sp. KRD291]|uniref:Rrf2 family transcriptional regulator n=1 Tax=Pseudonocardia sp. KRD291 TaxID=2792007 RepID=UPI001C4A5B23|nr:Rrf2 family transcriptional regulator [Pseudonocardia sp. KRD291]MBW0102689.1 Rrf2 family transcriptional regulator [Pseudonocardia sp. KRD291]